jgi:S-DNA-T family DNA segregation ATPase FtsK/SpoIIIE
MPATKTPPPDRRPHIVAFTLLAVGLIVSACVISHNPAKAPEATYPPEFTSDNLFGAPGAMLAENLVESLGFSVHVLLAGWFVLAVLLLLRCSLGTCLMRFSGWLLLVPCAAVLADRLSGSMPAPLAGGGGIIGASIWHALSVNFPPSGRVILLSVVSAFGAYLAADTVMIWIVRRAWAGLRALARAARSLVRKTVAAKPRQKRAPDVSVERSNQRAVPISRSGSLKPGEGSTLPNHYELPPVTLLEDPEPFPQDKHDEQLRDVASLLEKTFTDFGLNVRVVEIHTGPVVTQYEITLDTGIRLSKVTALADDLALNLKVQSVRIVAPIPGKNTVGIEVPNEHRAVVRLKELILASAPKVAKSKLLLFLGKDTEGKPLVYDMAEMPHLLIAGRTGTGKSVCLNAIMLSLLLTRRPDECKVIMIDPKRVEFSDYTKIPHLMCPVVKDDKKAEAILAWAVDKMEERYELLARARVRNIAGYNLLSHDEILRRVQPTDDERNRVPARMPQIVILIDEIGDLMMTMKKEVEGHIIRLAQKSRAAGIHLILATQKPTVDVITGLIKSNLPARICFQVSSRSDSRVVLDEMGADKLLGKGDMLFLQPGTSTLIRAQGAYASDQEIQRVVGFLECDPEYEAELLELKPTAKDGKGGLMESLRQRDELYDQAIEIVVREGRGSVSLLQRAMGIGYGRAARLIDFMAEDGIVGHYNGSQARDVLYTPEQWEQMKQGGQVGSPS